MQKKDNRAPKHPGMGAIPHARVGYGPKKR